MDIDEFDKIWDALMKGQRPNWGGKEKRVPSPIDQDEWDRQAKPADYELIRGKNNARYIFDLGGMEKEEIIVQMEGSSLMISGDSEMKSFLFNVDIESDLDNPRAKFNGGILEIIFDIVESKVVDIQIE
jgi:HSP20 family molecular chaperone IbpA